jgi:hypothetical protein
MINCLGTGRRTQILVKEEEDIRCIRKALVRAVIFVRPFIHKQPHPNFGTGLDEARALT